MTHATSCDLLVRNGDCTCRCGAKASDAPSVASTHNTETWIPCMLQAGHDGEHWSTSGCAGGQVRWLSEQSWKPPHSPMRQVSAELRAYIRADADCWGVPAEVLNALEDTEAAWRRDAAEIAAVWDVLEKGYLQFLPIRHESLVANVQRLVEMAQELDSIREVEAEA